MRTRCLTLVLALAASLSLVGIPVALAQPKCDEPFRVPQRSFKRLAAPNTHVWVDDIESSFLRGYSPFNLTIVVGNAYPLFRTDEGQLQPKDFEGLLAGAYGMTPTRVQVSEAGVKKGLSVPFTALRQAFALRVVSVRPSSGGEDAVMLQLCR